MVKPLVENEKLLRGILPIYVKSDNTISSAAFKPRNGEGVSVDRVADRTLEDAIEFLLAKLKRSNRVGSITVKQCNDIPVNIVLSPSTSDPFHVEIYSEDKAPLDSIKYENLAKLAVLER